MDQLIHLLEYRIIVCKRCKYAVLPSQIDAHFASKPHKADKKERQRIAEAVAEINGLIENEEALKSEFVFPVATSTPIAALAQPKKNGLQCTFETAGQTCQYICCTVERMQKHCWEEHGWKSKQKGGRPKKNSNRDNQVPWRTSVHCQRFFIQGHKSGYFEVQASTATATPQPSIASRASQFEAAKQELETALRQAEAEERQKIKEAEEAREPNP